MNNGLEKGSLKSKKSGKASYRKATKVHLKCHLCEFEYVEKTKFDFHMNHCHSDDKGQLISEVKGTFPCLQILLKANEKFYRYLHKSVKVVESKSP